jgi:predicted ATPase
MFIKKITIKNYKSFETINNQDIETLNLSKLNLIFGKNNNGKSTVARLPLFILGAMASKNITFPLTVNQTKFGNTFRDVMHGDYPDSLFFSVIANYKSKNLDFNIEANIDNKTKNPVILDFQSRSPQYKETSKKKLKGIFPSSPEWNKWRLLSENLLKESLHIAPTREKINPIYLFESPANIFNAPQIFAQNQNIATRVSKWFKENLENWELIIDQNLNSFQIMTRKENLKINLSYAGEGFQQIFPIVVHQIYRQLQTNKKPFLDIIEQPELHLHSAAQAPIADLLIDTSLNSNGQTLVETHSKSILYRIQRRVAEKKIDPDKIKIFFINNQNETKKIKEIKLMPSGELEWWPEGVFAEDFQEIVNIQKAIQGK